MQKHLMHGNWKCILILIHSISVFKSFNSACPKNVCVWAGQSNSKKILGHFTVVYLFYEIFVVDSIKTFLNDKADNTEAAMGLVYKINRDFKNRHPVYPL